MDVDKEHRGLEMYDLIASWMTSGGPLQELRRDERGPIRATPADIEPCAEPDRHGYRPSLGFARALREPRAPMTTACVDGCAAC